MKHHWNGRTILSGFAQIVFLTRRESEKVLNHEDESRIFYFKLPKNLSKKFTPCETKNNTSGFYK